MFFYTGQTLPQDIFGYWLFNDDEMFDNHVSGTTTTIGQSNSFDALPIAEKFKYKTPVPSFTGKWAANFYESVITKVFLTLTMEFNNSCRRDLMAL